MATTHARDLSLYDGQELVGTIKVAEDGTATAYHPCGKRLGQYPTVKQATTAFAAIAEPADSRND